MNIEVFMRTERGCVREQNEDRFIFQDFDMRGRRLDATGRAFAVGAAGVVLGVCDGMGGTGHGDVAASLAAKAFVRHLLEATSGLEDREQLLRGAVDAAEASIQAHLASHPEQRGMGTTLTALWVYAGGAELIHVGDSRAYRFREGGLEQLTHDHSVTGQMVAAGRMDAQEARNYPHKDPLLQAVGRGVQLAPQHSRVELNVGDTVLLCSDGLTKPLEDTQIAEIVAKRDALVRTCRALTERACLVGGRDNVTVVALRRNL